MAGGAKKRGLKKKTRVCQNGGLSKLGRSKKLHDQAGHQVRKGGKKSKNRALGIFIKELPTSSKKNEQCAIETISDQGRITSGGFRRVRERERKAIREPTGKRVSKLPTLKRDMEEKKAENPLFRSIELPKVKASVPLI